MNSVSPSILPQVVEVRTAREAWVKLGTTYASGSRAQVRDLKQQLHSLKKGNESISEYMQRAKLIADKLISLENNVSNDDLVDAIIDGLNGLGSPYRYLCRFLEARMTAVSYDDLFGLLLTEER